MINGREGGSYLPALVTANALGLQLGLLAKPSGETLTIPGESLLARGIQEPGLLSITYPNGEAIVAIYTGGALEIPVLSYSSGAYVGAETVKTRVAWTGMVNRRDFYSQILGASKLLENILGEDYAQEFTRIILLIGLTDSQTLDVASIIVENAEWFKTLGWEHMVEATSRIARHVQGGGTAAEALARIMVENKQRLSGLDAYLYNVYIFIPDEQLVDKIYFLTRCIEEQLGREAAMLFLEIIWRTFVKGFKTSLECAELRLEAIISALTGGYEDCEEIAKWMSKLLGISTAKFEKYVTADELLSRIEEAGFKQEDDVFKLTSTEIARDLMELNRIYSDNTNRKGVFTSKIAKIWFEKVLRIIGIEVDETENNKEGHFFDLQKKQVKEGKTVFEFVGEVKSTWEDVSFEDLFRDATITIEKRVKDTIMQLTEPHPTLDIDGSTKSGYLIAVRITPRGVEIKYAEVGIDWESGNVVRR